MPVLDNYGKYMGTAASLGIDEMKKLEKMLKMMKQVKMMKLFIISWRSVSGSLANISQSQTTKELRSALGYPELGSSLCFEDTLVSLKLP